MPQERPGTPGDPGTGAARDPVAVGTAAGAAVSGSRPRFDPDGPVSAPAARDVDALAEPLAEAVLACPAVAALSAGPFGTVGTYLPGRRVTGVQITDTEVTVRVVARAVPMAHVEAQVRTAVARLFPELPVHLGIDDLDPS